MKYFQGGFEMVMIGDPDVKKIGFFHGLSESELSLILDICEEKDYNEGDICQYEGVTTNKVNLILSGRVGTVVHMPNVACRDGELVMDALHEGEAFGWSALMKGTPWSTLRALNSTRTLTIDADILIELCEKDNHIGYILMKNLASLIAARLRKQRVTTLNTLLALKGEG
jgi:CRP/FNR family transcriptional regulator, cyclic AMP receptor protein